MLTVRYQQLGEPNGFGTMHLIEYCSGDQVVCRGVIDCGVNFQQINNRNITMPPSGNFLPDTQIDFIAITHAHMDHAGAIPRLVFEHPEAQVFMSGRSFKGAELLWKDSIKLTTKDYGQQKKLGNNPRDLFCGFNDLEFFLNNENLILVPDEGAWYESDDLKIGFHPSGHDQGAMMVALRYPNAPSILITGDICRHDQEIVQGVMLPKDTFLNEYDFAKHPLILITEGTNGSKTQSKSRNKLRSELFSVIREVQARSGVPFIPTFSRGRGSEMIRLLCREGFTVHVDGGIRKMSELELPEMPQLIEQGKVIFFEPDARISDRHRLLLAQGQDPCGHNGSPIISPSARLEGGPSVSHAINLLPDNKNALIAVGYLFPDSLANKVFKIRKGRTVSFENFDKQRVPVNVRCDTYHLSFSAHDDQRALIDRAWLLKAAEIIVHHCSEGSFKSLRSAMHKSLGRKTKVQRGEHGKIIELNL